MTLLSKALSYLAVAAFLLAGTLTGHHGHGDVGLSHASEHSTDLIAGLMPDAHHGDAEGQGDLDKTSCDFAHVSSCGMGHCCFPVPTAELAQTMGGSPVWASEVFTWERREDRLEPPPPKWA